LKGAEGRTFRDRQDADIEVVEVKGTQAMSMSWPEEAEDSWLEFDDRATRTNRRPSRRITSQLRRFPVLAVLVAVVALALAGCGIGNNRGPNSGAGDDNSFYRAENFNTALQAVKGKVGPGGDILEIRIEAKKADFTVREGKSEDATGWRAKAGNGGDLDSFGVDVVGEGSLANSAIPASDFIASALTRMEAQARNRDPEATLETIQFFTIDYDPTSQRPEWKMNVHGRLYLANLDGRNFRSPGEGAGTLTNPELSPTESNALKLSQCVTHAAGDVAKIERCQKIFAQ
jgi:hypothetical protein